MELVFDTAVVGAGPAGSSAAITLARRGARVALLEAEEFPREKLCGEFLSPEIPGLLAQLGARSHVGSLGPVEIAAVRMTAPDGTAWERGWPQPGWGLSRAALDRALVEQATRAGARVWMKTTATNIRGDLRHGFEIETTHGSMRARTVIAAYGKRAALDRTLGRAFLRRPQPFLALKAHHLGRPLGGRVELHTFPGGYCGLAEVEGGRVNVCLLVRAAAWRAATHGRRDPVQAFCEWMQRQNPYLHDWLSAAERIDERWLSIAQVPFCDKPAAEGDILMAGDAGGLIVPLTGDGIAIALRSGMMAAEECERMLAGALSTRAYGTRWQRAFGRRYLLGRALQAILLQPHLAPPALRAAAALPPLADWIIARTREMV